MIKVCSRNMCAGTGWRWRGGGVGGLRGLVVRLQNRERGERKVCSCSRLPAAGRGMSHESTASSASCCGESAARPVCGGGGQSVSRAPQFKEGVRVCVCTSIIALPRRSGGCFPAAWSRGYYSAAGRRPHLPKGSIGVVTGLIYSAIKGGSVEAHTGILCFQCGIHNHNPGITPEAVSTSVLCWTAGVVIPARSRGN